MAEEPDLGRWLEALGVARAGCVFSGDVADTMSVLELAATSVNDSLRVVSLTWQEVPPLANELGLLVSALARATSDFFPSLYGRRQADQPSRWSKALIESEAHAITRAVPDVDGAACRRILGACRLGEIPSLGRLPRAEQARQFALAIEPHRLLVVIGVLKIGGSSSSVKSLAQGIQWLAENSRCRVAVVVPRELSERHELDHVAYGAYRIADAAPPKEMNGAGSASPAAALLHGSSSRSEPAEPVVRVSPIVGQPAKRSEAEQVLYTELTNDEKLRPLFAFNRPVRTRAGTSPIVDVLWEAGRLAIEIDGLDHLRKQRFAKDRIRDYELWMTGYSVVRFTDGSVTAHTQWVVNRIREAVRYISEREKT